MASIRMTNAVVSILTYMVEHEGKSIYGYELFKSVNVGIPTGYSVLHKLEGLGWVKSQWKNPIATASKEERPRRYYQLTREGIREARKALGVWFENNQPIYEKVMGLFKTAG